MAGSAEFEVVLGKLLEGIEVSSVDDAAADAVWLPLLNAVPVCAPPDATDVDDEYTTTTGLAQSKDCKST